MAQQLLFRDERALGTSRIKTVPDHFSALTNLLL